MYAGQSFASPPAGIESDSVSRASSSATRVFNISFEAVMSLINRLISESVVFSQPSFTMFSTLQDHRDNNTPDNKTDDVFSVSFQYAHNAAFVL